MTGGVRSSRYSGSPRQPRRVRTAVAVHDPSLSWRPVPSRITDATSSCVGCEVPEAARRLGIPAREVYERIDRGELDARKVAGRVEVRIPT